MQHVIDHRLLYVGEAPITNQSRIVREKKYS